MLDNNRRNPMTVLLRDLDHYTVSIVPHGFPVTMPGYLITYSATISRGTPLSRRRAPVL
jgi:hypothetical protein